MADIFDLPVIQTSEFTHISLSVLLDPDNFGRAVMVPLLSCIQADILVIAYKLSVNSGHLWFTCYPDVGEYPRESYRVAGARKCGGSRWNSLLPSMKAEIFVLIVCTPG